MDQPRRRFPLRALAVSVALVAVVAVAAGLSAGVATSSALANDTPALDIDQEDSPYLSPPEAEVTREDHAQPGLDLSAAAATDAQRLRGQHSAATVEQRFETTDNQSTFVASVAANLSVRADALDEHHARLLADYGAGELSTPRLLRELAQASAGAAQHQALADRIETVVAGEDITLPQDIQEQFVALDAEIPALESPVTDALVAGEFDPEQTVYVQATDEAVVLAVAGPIHTRQATLRNERDRDGVNQFIEEAEDGENPNSLALERTEELYPGYVAFSPPPFDATTVYGIQGNTASGSFVAYLDGATRNIFHEQQLVTAADVPVSAEVTNSTNGLELTVETTHPTGPMRVSVTDGEESVAGANLQVDNRTVGTTDADGQRWVTQPLDGATVTVTVDERTVQVALD